MGFRLVYASSSLIPLYVLLVIMELLSIVNARCDSDEKTQVNTFQIAMIIIILAIMGISVFCLYKILKSEQKKSNENQVDCKSGYLTFKENRTISINYFLTIILPVLSLNYSITTWNQEVVSLLLIFILIYLQALSYSADFNIILYFLGYKVYAVSKGDFEENINCLIKNKHQILTLRKCDQEKLAFNRLTQSQFYLLHEVENN